MESKVCIKCGEEKPLDEFYLNKGKHINTCKICKNEQSKKYRENNSEYFKNYHVKYQQENKETLTEYRRDFFSKYKKGGELEERRIIFNEKHKIVLQKRKKDYRDKHKEKNKEYQKIYAKINREKLNEYSRNYNKKNPHIKMWITTLYNSLKRLGQKKEGHTIDLLGYSPLELKTHITSLFTDGMSWNNYGEWHIDHIKPVSKFENNTPMNIVNALSNLQPLWSTTREINGIIYIGNLNKNKY